MAELHDALKRLSGVDWDTVPQDNEGLARYMNDCFTCGELICNTIPAQPNGTLFADSKPHNRTPNSADSHKDIHTSSARPDPPHKDHESLQKHWGKPYKFKAEQNPLNASIYKLAGNDRHGAWFGRRSTHEGLGFDKWKRAMQREFSESMSVSGGPGAGAIRGIAADRRLEQTVISGTGKLEAYELSAQFPGPTTPRDFTAVLLSTEDALTEKSASQVDGKKHVPRHFMVVSRPLEHPDAPLRTGYVRGHYESVEMIREIPLAVAKPKTNSASESSSNGPQDGDDPELNPVEWIMITRSDPGGGIPRFLVERGTPEAMLTDLQKFFDWACGLSHIPDADENNDKQATSAQDVQKQEPTQSTTAPANNIPNGDHEGKGHRVEPGPPTAKTPPTQPPQQEGGMMSNLTGAIAAGFDSYAPTTLSNMVHSTFDPAPEQYDSDDSSDSSSVESFMSAKELRRLSTAPEVPKDRGLDSTDTLSVASAVSETPRDPKDLNRNEKEVVKLTQKREKLEQQLAKKRMAEETKLKESQEKEDTDISKQKEEMQKKLRKTEEKHQKEIEKLEAKKAKEERKAEEKRRKKDDQYRLSMVVRERDDYRSQSDLYRRENNLLREQMAELQFQNNVLAQKLSQVGGQDVLKAVQADMGHNRSESMKSAGSMASSESTMRISDNKTEGPSMPPT